MSLDPDTVRRVQQWVGVRQDGILGPVTLAAVDKRLRAVAEISDELAALFPNRAPAPVTPRRTLEADESWPWRFRVIVEGDDLVVENVRCTCFGGAHDPQDNGQTASGVSTLDPRVIGCALPMNYQGPDDATRRALAGSPLPMLPWGTQVLVTVPAKAVSLSVPLLDLGPHKRTGNGIDLTVAAARRIDPAASARNFEAMVNYRVPDGARYL